MLNWPQNLVAPVLQKQITKCFIINLLIPPDSFRNEPHHEKTCLCHMRTTKVQISLHSPGPRSTVQGPAAQSMALQHSPGPCRTVQGLAAQSRALQNSSGPAAQSRALQHSPVPCSTIQGPAAQSSALQQSKALQHSRQHFRFVIWLQSLEHNFFVDRSWIHSLPTPDSRRAVAAL